MTTEIRLNNLSPKILFLRSFRESAESDEAEKLIERLVEIIRFYI